MSRKIILNSDEAIVCPKCSEKFPLHQGIARQTVEKYEKEFEQELEQRKKDLSEELGRYAEKKAEKTFTAKLTDLQEKLEEKEESLKHAEDLVKKARAEEKTKAEKEYSLELKNLQEELEKKAADLNQFRKNELELRKDKVKLEEEKQNLELEVQRKLDEEREKIKELASKTEADKFRLREAEYKKKLEDAQKSNDELARKLERGSQQLQGEVLELELEDILKASFPHDNIEAVKKGARGADVLQGVYTPAGQLCGSIIWEAKRAENWSDKWIQKLKDDRLHAGAEIAVLVSTTLPKDMNEPFAMIGDVWIATDQVVRPVAETLRSMLIEANKLKLANVGKNEKMELLYNYLCSPQFSQKVRAVVEAFVNMKSDLDKERNAMMRIWKKREVQIERVATSMTEMIGELQGLAQDSLPQLEEIDMLALPSGDED